MSRTTILIGQHDPNNPRVVFRPREPVDVPMWETTADLNCDVSVSPFTDLAAQSEANQKGSLVREVGTALYERLSVHPGVKAALDRITNAAPNDPCPIYLELLAPAAEGLPFEALFLPDQLNQRFVALDGRSPIVRVAMVKGQSGVIERLCTVPLRAAAVISAAERQVSEEEEWRVLYKAFKESSVKYELLVLVGRKGLLDIIAQTQDPCITAVIIDGDRKKLMKTISDFSPAVLHFFCHGNTKSPRAYLEVGRDATHDLGDEPLYLSHDDFRDVCNSLLLVTLNACKGAAAMPDSYSLALGIAQEGVPMVVGMREAIDPQDANLFTGAFYEALLQELHRALSNPQAEPPDWPALLRAPRDRLAERHGGPPGAAAQAHKRWSLPVLYVRPEELCLRRGGTMEQLGELQFLRSLRGTFSKASPPEMLAAIEQRIAELEKALPL
jgi:hypothetical protein